ncbi:MAG: hypothetical protein PHC61_00765 [Chitinivibrionales bacterium]|nr:hypothetical protein [Chitinivibrionales bacterium]
MASLLVRFIPRVLFISGLLAMSCILLCTTQKNIVSVVNHTDTLRVASGNPVVAAVGLVVGGIRVRTTRLDTVYADTCYAYFSVTANPPLRNLRLSVNNNLLVPVDNRFLSPFAGGYMPGFFPMNIPAAEYSAYFFDTAAQYRCAIPVSYFADGSAGLPTEDTLRDTVALPSVIDSLAARDGKGAIYDSVNIFGIYAADSLRRRIPLNTDLMVTWHGDADWYGVECRRYYYNGSSFAAQPAFLDTFTTDKQLAIPHTYFYHDTAVDSASYNFLYVNVVGVNGPAPKAWDLPAASFNGKGFLLCMRGVVSELTLEAYPKYLPQGGVGKMRSTAGAKPLNKADAVGILSRILSKQD